MNDSDLVQWLASATVQQRCYRQILDAFSYPGSLHPLCSEACEPLWVALATLVDGGATLSDCDQLIPDELAPFFDVPRLAASAADFVICNASKPPREDWHPKLGTIYQPHLGAMLLLRCESLGKEGLELQVSGPGVRATTSILVDGLHARWIAVRERWVGRFPTGVDILLCDAASVVGLPRTAVIEVVSRAADVH